MMMQDAVLIVATVFVVLGLMMILWLELAGAALRRKGGRVRDVGEVLLPVAPTLLLLIWSWRA